MGARNQALGCFSCCFGVILLVAIILFSLSFHIVQINQVALKKNTFSVQVEPGVVYQSGRYFTGLAGKFLTYPTTWFSVAFSSDAGSDSTTIRAKTSQATEVELDITFMYRLQPEYLHLLFAKYPAQNQHVDIVNTAKERIQRVVTQYTVDEFFTKRTEITGSMAFEVTAALRNSFYAEVTVFLLREIILESRFEDNILAGLISLRQADTALQKLQINQMQGEISVIDSTAQVQIDQTAATASVQAATIRATQEAAGDGAIQRAISSGLKPFKSDLMFTNDQINQFQYYDKLRNFNRSTLYAGFGSGAVFSF